MKTAIGERVLTKRVYEPASSEDGIRVLVTRYWPRGVSKESVNEYVSTLGPSRELLQSYRSGEITWESFREQYLEEMRGEDQLAEIHRLAKLARSERITLLCVCDEPERCHRWLLRELVLGFDDGP